MHRMQTGELRQTMVMTKKNDNDLQHQDSVIHIRSMYVFFFYSFFSVEYDNWKKKQQHCIVTFYNRHEQKMQRKKNKQINNKR